MNEELFKELVISVKEGGAILRGDLAPARAFVVDGPACVLLQVAGKLPKQLGMWFGPIDGREARAQPKSRARLLNR